MSVYVRNMTYLAVLFFGVNMLMLSAPVRVSTAGEVRFEIHPAAAQCDAARPDSAQCDAARYVSARYDSGPAKFRISPDVNRALFPYPDELKPQVNFWIKIFTQYTTKQVVIHDNRYMDIIYAAVELSDVPAPVKGKKQATNPEAERYKIILRKLDALKPGEADSLTGDEQRVYNLFKDVAGEHKFLDAVDRVRSQVGQSDRFKVALARSTMYLADMEKIFAERGLPVELTRLPFVESSFNVQACSKDGALGLWQFMAGTGKKFMHIGKVSDDRKNIMKSTEAAARLLSYNYGELGSWPLALTAYNHGLCGIKKAVNRTGSADIARITKDYTGPYFGFASRNFYAEFIAVLEVLKDVNGYFGDVGFMERDNTDVFTLPKTVTFDALVKNVSLVEKDELIRLNPELTKSAVKSQVSLPKGYGLKLPAGLKEEYESRFERQFASLPDTQPKVVSKARGRGRSGTVRLASARAGHRVVQRDHVVQRAHVVQKGQTVYSISKRYNVSVQSLMTANSIGGTHKIKLGRKLRIPRS
ncbi:MAG: transglycosylase SLT domain-containing protein [Nitrospirae bacterium]|nr:transglycosylase SLT domain-containing protein [Nitrospirota bacterium]